MATNWMRWNDTTHVFEKSSDGISFIPVPINASCISEGTLPPAVIPGGGNAPDLAGNNVFSGINTFSGVAPSIRFNETDGGVNQKNWEILESSSILYLGRTLNDALAGPVNLFSIDRNGNLSVNAVTSAVHTFSANVDGANQIHFVNTNAGVSAYSGLVFQNSGSDGRGYVIFTSGGYSNPSFVADGLNFYSAGSGGILLNAGAAAAITFRTSNALRLTISGAGVVTIPGALNVSGAVDFDASLIVGTTLQVAGVSTLVGTIGCNAINCGAINTQGNSITGVSALTASGGVTGGAVNATGVQTVTLAAANSTVALAANVSMLRVNGAGFSIQTITGGVTGRILFIMCISSGMTLATGGNITLATGTIGNGSGVIVIFDGTYWRVQS